MKKIIYLIIKILFLSFVSCRSEGLIKDFSEISILEIKSSSQTSTYLAVLRSNTLKEFVEYEWLIENENFFTNIEYRFKGKEMTLTGEKSVLDKVNITLKVTLTNGKVLYAKFSKASSIVELEGGLWIKDSNLRNLIRNKLNKSFKEEISKEEVKKIEKLEGRNLDILTLAGLENLGEIYGNWDLSFNKIYDLSPIENLDIKGTLNLNNNPLFQTNSVKIIDSFDNVIEEFEENLSHENKRILGTITGNVYINNTIDIQDNILIDVVIPVDLNLKLLLETTLGEERLYTSKNGNKYILLEVLEKLNGLDAKNKDIDTLEGLNKLSKITGIWNLKGNNISDINPFENLEAFEELILDGNKLFPKEVRVVVDGKNNILESEVIRESPSVNQIILETLKVKGKVSIEEVEFEQIKDTVDVVVPVDNVLRSYIYREIGNDNLFMGKYALLKDVEELMIYISPGYGSSNRVRSFDGLQNLKKIKQLVVGYGYFSDLSGLENLSEVEGRVAFSYNSLLTDITALSNLKEIGGDFDISGNNLSDLTGLSNLRKIGGALNILNMPNFYNLNGLNEIESIDVVKLVNLRKFDSFEGLARGVNIRALILGIPVSINNNSLESLTDQAIEELRNRVSSGEVSIEQIFDNR